LGRHERIPRGWDRQIAAESQVRAGDTPSGREWLFEPGAATILGICDLGDRFRLVLNEVDVAAPDQPLPSFRSPGRSRTPSRTWRRRPSRGSSHSWENQFVDRTWTYLPDSAWTGLQQCYDALAADLQQRHDVELTSVGALGVSAMMHGYLPSTPTANFDTLPHLAQHQHRRGR
jgi:L-arabinose isomerase C-terminal domain